MARKDLLPFERIWPVVAGRVVALGTETVPVFDGAGRVLRADACAVWDLPRADNSAMDGFAVRSADLATASEATPVFLRLLSGDAYAGQGDLPVVETGFAAPIGTGGRIPPGADAVVAKEQAGRSEAEIKVAEPVPAGRHIRRAAEELAAGSTVGEAGGILDAARLASIAMAGVPSVEVGLRPRVTILSTGNELVSAGQPASAAQVVETNGPYLRLAVMGVVGVEPRLIGPVRDDEASLRTAFDRALDRADVLIVTGGMSVGDRDLVRPLLEQSYGVERLFWGVSLKPGKPMFAGLRDRQWIVGLPGNPGSVAAGWYVFVRPLLLALMGASAPQPARRLLRLSSAVKPDRERTMLRWCRSVWRGAECWAEPLPHAASHMMSDFARSDMLAILPPSSGEIPAGTVVEAIERI